VRGFIERDLEEETKDVTPFMVQQKLTQRYEELKEIEEQSVGKSGRQVIALIAGESGG